MSAMLTRITSQEFVGQEAFVRPELAVCSAPYKTRGKKLSWSHGFTIEAGPDSSAPAPVAVWVPRLRLDSARVEGMI